VAATQAIITACPVTLGGDMVFSSHLFIFYFLPLVLLLNYTLPFRFLSLMLVGLSYCFYGWMNPKWILVMFTSSFIDFFCGLALLRWSGLTTEGPELPLLPKGGPRNRAQKAALSVSIISNLSILGFFKYFDFGITNLNAVMFGLGFGSSTIRMLHVALPIGISFYTFQSMSYAIDVYRGVARPMRNPIDFACFVAVFPHQLAGPIIRYWSIADQFRSRTLTYTKFARGAGFFCIGLSKKILLANAMAHVADAAFSADKLHTAAAWYGVVAYAFQIYFDFSGYSDMAVGMALMLGFLFTKNFNDPYRAVSITDFWRRWHIALSTWLRDYLYLPLGGNRYGERRTYVNLMTVMLVGGLWHGASWNFVIWGGIHGGMLAAERARSKDSFYGHFPRMVQIAVTFAIVCIGWVFFRAESLHQTWTYLKSMAGLAAAAPGPDVIASSLFTPYHLSMFVLCAILVWSAPQTWTFTQKLTVPKISLCLGLLGLSVVFMWTQTVNPFLYFQF
jgi:alginate O-acetyltransferase complex protein AlgI